MCITYLIESDGKADQESIHAFMLDAEINTIVAFPGLRQKSLIEKLTHRNLRFVMLGWYIWGTRTC